MHKKLKHGRYWNCGDAAVAIVAVLTYTGSNKQLMDWAAYIGSCSDTSREEIAMNYVSSYGCKLWSREAHFFFPDLPIEKYKQQEV